MRSFTEFRRAFDRFGGSVLKDLDWNNVGVAGGSMLACLTSTEFGKFLRNSDIDLFIWGLDAKEMQRKLEHIKKTIVTNVPNFASTYRIERSAGAMTFIPRLYDYGRKIRVVLRGFSNPAEILSSFDLDPACILFDGHQVWLSLRALRAFFTGYTITTGAISSSFAARIVKYATRGYGIRVQPDKDDPDTDELLLSMEATFRAKDHSVSEAYLSLPWRNTSNYRRVFSATKSQALNNWTHSFSALSALAALWNLAHATGRIGELMDEVGAASHIYGAYEGSDTFMTTFQPKEWIATLTKVVKDSTMSKPLLLVVILPHMLRQHLNATGKFSNLARMRDTEEVVDASGDKLEICLWSITQDTMWQAATGMESVVHQLLVTSAMLTAWTIWKVSSGAPWPTMYYGRSWHNAQVFSYSAALARIGDFDDWIRT
ncbi:hypothetical protein CF327_g3514 [Tilletia walkeri]|nr:hypothetical protein CF327_g3514 [Tilletia walkeri]